MTRPLLTYLHDHLAGAKFAISLLTELSEQALDTSVAKNCGELLKEVEFDKLVLEKTITHLGGDDRNPKNGAEWVAQKASRFKLDISTTIGLFEALEMLTLGVLGKRALWDALHSIADDLPSDLSLDFHELRSRADQQHARLESMRLDLAKAALR